MVLILCIRFQQNVNCEYTSNPGISTQKFPFYLPRQAIIMKFTLNDNFQEEKNYDKNRIRNLLDGSAYDIMNK